MTETHIAASLKGMMAFTGKKGSDNEQVFHTAALVSHP